MGDISACFEGSEVAACALSHAVVGLRGQSGAIGYPLETAARAGKLDWRLGLKKGIKCMDKS
jgi:hypothetical protein